MAKPALLDCPRIALYTVFQNKKKESHRARPQPQFVYSVTHGIKTMYIVTEYTIGMQRISLPGANEYLCPECKNGLLIFRDYCKRVMKLEGGDVEWVDIPRHRCDNPACGKVHRMLPDILAPFKHYQESVITDAIDDRIDPDTSDDRPSATTVIRWKHWLMMNWLNIDGCLKSVGHRELGFSEELMKSGVSLLEKLRSSIPEGWLKEILRIIYNSGGRLTACYD